MTTVSGSTCAVTAVSKSPATIQLKSVAVNDPPDTTVEKSEQDATNEPASADTATQCARRPMTPPKNMLRSAPTRGKAGISQTVDDTGSCYGAVTAGVKVGTATPASDARRVHDHRDAGEAQETAEQLEAIGALARDDGAPREREDDEHATVRRVGAGEWRGLEGRNDAVQDQHRGADGAEQRALALAEPAPHQIAAADLAEPGGDEQRQRNEHELSPHDAISFAGRRRPAWYHPARAPAVSHESLGALRPVPAPRRGRLGLVSRLASDGSRSPGRVDAAALPRPEDAVHALPRGPARQRDAGRGPGRAIGHVDDGGQAGGPPRPARGDSPRGGERRARAPRGQRHPRGVGARRLLAAAPARGSRDRRLPDHDRSHATEDRAARRHPLSVARRHRARRVPGDRRRAHRPQRGAAGVPVV